MKAIIETGGKQYYVSEGDVIYVEKLDAETGKDITFEEVLMVDGQVGTPTVKRVLPLLYDEDIAFFSAFTGASFLRNDKNENFINFRASYKQEIEALINYLSKQNKLDKIAYLDDFNRVKLRIYEINRFKSFNSL